MKGLILKDLYMAAKYCRFYVLIAIVFAVASIWGNSSFLMFYPILLASAIPVNLISYDEKSRWTHYSGTLPYTKKQLVSVKYIIGLITLALSVILILTGQIVNMLVNDTFSLKLIINLIVVLAVFGFIAPCCMLPVIFKFGVEKGRIVFLVMLVVVGVAFGALGAMSMDTNVTAIILSMKSWIIPAIAVAGVIMLTLSWMLSVRFYEKREV